MDLTQIPIPSDDFCVREVGEETVFLAESGDEILSLNEVGSHIWRQIDGTRSLQDILDSVCREYEVDVEQARDDLVAFVRQLDDRDLVSWRIGRD